MINKDKIMKASVQHLGHSEFSLGFKAGTNNPIILLFDKLPEDEQIDADTISTILAAAELIPDDPLYLTADVAKLAMAEWINAFTNKITGPVPDDEKLSWAAKEAASRAYVSDTSDALQTAMIEGEATLTGENPSDLANSIISNADLYRAVVTQVSGIRRVTNAALDGAVDPADYETILNGAMVKANDALAALSSQ